MNQRIIKIKKNALIGEYVDLFLLWNVNADLDKCPDTFSMWMYFAITEEEKEIPMRQQHICSLTGMSVSSYKRAFKKLKNKGYLKKEEQGNNYIFSATAFDRIIPHLPGILLADPSYGGLAISPMFQKFIPTLRL